MFVRTVYTAQSYCLTNKVHVLAFGHLIAPLSKRDKNFDGFLVGTNQNYTYLAILSSAWPVRIKFSKPKLGFNECFWHNANQPVIIFGATKNPHESCHRKWEPHFRHSKARCVVMKWFGPTAVGRTRHLAVYLKEWVSNRQVQCSWSPSWRLAILSSTRNIGLGW